MKANKSLFGASLLLGGALLVCGANAMTFQDTVNVQFSFDVSLGITLSSQNLVISELSPGNAAHSNTIIATVATNNAYGYTLSAMVGGTGQTAANNTLYSSATNTSFASLASNADITLASFNDNNWGYTTATSINDNTKYSGLEYNTGKTINKTTNYSGTAADGYTGTDSTSFTIGAKAASTQASGDYSNVITFAVVSNAASVLYMQDVSTWGSTLSTGDEITAIDSRDGKSYTVAKLADGNIWMTQNLDLDITTQGAYNASTNTYTAFTNENTDIGWNTSTNSYDTATWTPSSAAVTKATNDTTWLSYSTSGRTTPQSYDPGDLCWNGTLDEDWETTLSTGTINCSNSDDKHYHIGNYYNWTAAVAMNDTTDYTQQNTDLNQSICPAGWRLPIGGTTNTGSKSFYYLANELSLTGGMNGNVQDSPTYFVYGGDWYGSSAAVGSSGGYWSSVVYNSDVAYMFQFNVDDNWVHPQYRDLGRVSGSSVRCVAR